MTRNAEFAMLFLAHVLVLPPIQIAGADDATNTPRAWRGHRPAFPCSELRGNLNCLS